MERDVSAELRRRMEVAENKPAAEERARAAYFSWSVDRVRAREQELTEQLVEVLDKQQQAPKHSPRIPRGRTAKGRLGRMDSGMGSRTGVGFRIRQRGGSRVGGSVVCSEDDAQPAFCSFLYCLYA